MKHILLPMDGSAYGQRALDQVLQRPDVSHCQLHLLNVQLPVDGHVQTFVSADVVDDYHRAEGLAVLEPAAQSLQQAGIAHQRHVLVGHPATMICRFASSQSMDEVVMGTHGRTGLLHLLMGSVAEEVKEHCAVPVTWID